MNSTAIGALDWGFFDRFNDRNEAAKLFASEKPMSETRALAMKIFAKGERGQTTVVPAGGMAFTTSNEIKYEGKTYLVVLTWQYRKFSFKLTGISLRRKDE